VHLEREKRWEGTYVIATGAKDLEAQDAVAWYQELIEVEPSFRQVKDGLALRPLYQRVEPRVKAHIFVAAPALVLPRWLRRGLQAAEVALSAAAMTALSCVRPVTVRVHDSPRSGVRAASARAHPVLQALGISDLRPPTPPGAQPTVV
jgi:hypothetical protein